jgi:hypothetical protein
MEKYEKIISEIKERNKMIKKIIQGHIDLCNYQYMTISEKDKEANAILEFLEEEVKFWQEII